MRLVSEKKELTRALGAAQSPERIKDPRSGLERMEEALKHILEVPKSAVSSAANDGHQGEPK